MKNNVGRSILVVVAFIGLIVASYARRAVRQSEAEQEQIRQQIDDRMHSEEFQQQIADMAESRQQLSQQFNEILSNLPENQKAAPDVKTVRYLVYYGGVCHVDMYIITPDLNVKKYSINPEGDKNYDYFAGELPSEDRYEVTEIKISDAQWSDIVDTLTRVNFMELKEDVSTKEMIDDGSSYYISVETSDATNTSGGYMAGYDGDDTGRQFAEAKEVIEKAVKGL